MTFDNVGRKHVEDFLAAIEPVRLGYRHSSLSYFAVRSEDIFVLIRGLLSLEPSSSADKFGQFESQNIRAGRIPLSKLELDERGFIEALARGGLDTPQGHLAFPPPPGDNANHAPYFRVVPADAAGPAPVNLLSVRGGHLPQVDFSRLDWELKVHDTPYKNLQELAGEYQLAGLLSDSCQVDVIGRHVAEIEDRSCNSGNVARVHVRLAIGLQPKLTTLHYRVLGRDSKTERRVLAGSSGAWKEEEDCHHGDFEFLVPEASVVSCVIAYRGLGQHEMELSDPMAEPNARRAAYEVFDPKLGGLIKKLESFDLLDGDARKLEPPVATLFWLLGFGVTRLGVGTSTEKAVDLLATTPSGHFLLVECTTGILKEDKLLQLYARSSKLRRALDASGNSDRRSLAVIVTTQRREDLVGFERATELGIRVLALDDIRQAIELTRLRATAEQYTLDLEAAVHLAQVLVAQNVDFGNTDMDD